MREMIRAFRDLGHEVRPVIMGGREESYNSTTSRSATRRVKDAIRGVTPNSLWESLKDYRLLWKDRQFEKRLAEEIEAFRPQVIYERANYLQLSGVRVAQRYGIDHVLEVNAPYVEERETLSGAKSWFQERAECYEGRQLRQTTEIAVVSEALRDHFLQNHDVGKDKFTVVPNAINPSKANADMDRVRAIRNRYGLSNATVAGFVGSILPWHGVDLLVKACHRIQENHDTLKILIVGDGSVLPKLKKFCRREGLTDRVVFTGRVEHSDVFNFIEAMDIAVMPCSNWYGSPVKIFEYGAMGAPVIAPDSGPVKEVMENGEEGLLVAPELDALLKALRTLLKDEQYRRRIASTFQEKVLSKHTWKQNAKKITAQVK